MRAVYSVLTYSDTYLLKAGQSLKTALSANSFWDKLREISRKHTQKKLVITCISLAQTSSQEESSHSGVIAAALINTSPGRVRAWQISVQTAAKKVTLNMHPGSAREIQLAVNCAIGLKVTTTLRPSRY